ncbi:MAG: arginine--tRNA ligase [Acidobacteriia bacterium]|jgi:arginyl-tRNA synthetase|nr:arginine--tRNA ligase [Terriglobia bacterium]
MYQVLENRVRETLERFLRERYGVSVHVAISRPPKTELGEMATPVCFELARLLRRPPRPLAEEMASLLPSIPGIERWTVAGGGYLNAYLDRAAFFREAALAETAAPSPAPDAPKIIVEHTNINPNKAAHIGHLRNAVLGDTFVRLLRHTGHRVEVQNYIDNTGVQVADVVVGFLHLEKKPVEDVRQLATQPKFDFYCWDLYARVTQFFEEDPARIELRNQALKAIEEGHGTEAELAELIATTIVRCHLRTMERLGVEYDLLPRESEILRLKFWDAAFALLKQRGAVVYATSGKNAGCWVMPLGDADEPTAAPEAKILVRSNGTVTYVGKDIAYQLWKFGLLDRDFAYRRFHTHPSGHTVWVTASEAGEPDAPCFGRADQVFNVIDSRQSYLQNIVVAGLRALGYSEQADRSVHFAYEMVALSPRCAEELGYPLSEEERRRAYVEVSGRRGTGVKADDLLDRLEARARAEVDARHPDDPAEERATRAHAIAVSALRYYLLKYTRNTVVAFDFKDALSFEGETGPYCQYAVVRARNIFRKWAMQQMETSEAADGSLEISLTPEQAARFLAPPEGNEFWELVLLAGSLDAAVHAAVTAQEPAFVAKYAFQLAQAFNNFYHRHHILTEADATRQAFLLMLTSLVMQQLEVALALLGIEAPEKM